MFTRVCFSCEHYESSLTELASETRTLKVLPYLGGRKEVNVPMANRLAAEFIGSA